MPAKRAGNSKARRAPARASGRLNRVDLDVIAGLKQAIAHVRGRTTLPVRKYEVPSPVDVKSIRAGLGLSQAEFARRYGFNLRTLQDWELGRSRPPSAARAYLIVIHRYPRTVEKALLGAA